MNLVIGNTSQLANFFPNDYKKISSRNLILNDKNFYDTVYITFAEQRTFNGSLCEKDFVSVNVDYTSKVIDYFSKISKKVVIYGTAELWNDSNGPIDLFSEIKYKYSPYIKSKEILYNLLKNNRLNNKWCNVNIIHPFNFNSLGRKEGFLFYKIFESIINNKIINVGYLDINRDIIHPKYLVLKSIDTKDDLIVGSGKLTNIKTFISDLYLYFNKQINDFLIEDKNAYSKHKNNEFWLNTTEIYSKLLEDTVSEFK
jgi:nucleoside-diphosphate-sugar epimerase